MRVRQVIRGSQIFLGVAVLFGINAALASAQSGASKADSLRTYELSEIVVGGSSGARQSTEAIRRVSIASIVRQDAPSVAALVPLIPSAHLQTNSRGESLIYIRNAGERQVAVFFDGALLNIPWDYRVDMSLIPTGMLGGMAVSRGVPSVIYGANVIGGAVNLQSRSMDGTGSHAESTIQLGSNSSRLGRAIYLWRTKKWSAVVSGGLFSSDGQRLPNGANLEFSQIGGKIRTNTDRNISNVFARISRLGNNDSELGFSILHVDSKKGIAPEGHIDPERDRVRYWRYPLWRNTMFIANARTARSPVGQLRATVWIGRFDQHIEQFRDNLYNQLTDLEEDEDRTIGLRLVGSRSLGPGEIRASINWLRSIHSQIDLELAEDPLRSSSLTQQFKQVLFSSGLELEMPIRERIGMTVGASLDGSATPETGDKPARDTDIAGGVTGSLRYKLGDQRLIRISVGRKVRFPTMRELFGEALHRFELNPDLRPETSFQADAAFEVRGDVISGEIVAFYRRTFDTIDQIVLDIEGTTRRKRINLDGSRVRGVEVAGSIRLFEYLTAHGHVSWMKPEALIGSRTRKLIEKPELLGSISVNVITRWGGSFQANLRRVGRAYGQDLNNDQVALPPSSELNLRAAIRRYFHVGGIFIELYAGLNNVTDEVVSPQLGLPGIGREMRAGASLSF
ncbi:MAG: TonB-dependent receptor [Bacteroidetes bacterium]|nr:TonB-dependent receptor [Bacteroidota bacterium]